MVTDGELTPGGHSPAGIYFSQMSPEDPSLSDREQRILAEIEANLEAEDPDLARRVNDGRSRKANNRILRLSVLGLIVGLALLIGNITNLVLGVLGFGVLLASLVGIVSSTRGLSGGGPSSALRDALRKAEERMRPPRPPGPPPDQPQ
jgi:hypothetical protein